MTREAELRQSLLKQLQITEDRLEHLIVHLKIKLSESCPDNTILRLLKYDEYSKHIAERFLEELKDK